MGSNSDREIIAAFVAHLQKNGYPDLKIDRYPEDENRNTKEIDAIAGAFAIEHTSVDTLPNQRRDSSWFLRAIGDLESELTGSLDYRLRISVPYEAIEVRQDWNAIKMAFREWIVAKSAALDLGKHQLQDIEGIPFAFHVTKSVSGKPGALFFRYLPEDATLPERLKTQLSEKARKLTPYQDWHFSTILLLESDCVLMDQDYMFDSIRSAFDGRMPNGVDHIWFVQSDLPDDLLFYDFTPHFERN
jgi:hypothetical protein